MINIHHHVYGYVSSSSVSVIRCLGPSQKPLQKRQAFVGSSVLPFYYYHHVSGIRNPEEEVLITNSISCSRLDFTNNASPSSSSSSSSSSSFASDSESKNNSGNKVSYMQVREIKERCNKWKWRGHTINYLLINSNSNSNSRPPLLLVHGFGASIPHWRRYYY